jgi:hypothetical protein
MHHSNRRFSPACSASPKCELTCSRRGCIRPAVLSPFYFGRFLTLWLRSFATQLTIQKESTVKKITIKTLFKASRIASIALLGTTLTLLTPAFSQVSEASSATIVLAGTSTGIVYSTTGGAIWNTLANFNTPVTALAIDPTNASIIYAGVYNAVYKTSDTGVHWTEETASISMSLSTVTALVIDPLVPSTIYAGTGNPGNGVYKSVDSGATWTAMNTGLQKNTLNGISLDVQALAIDPINHLTLYVGGNAAMYTARSVNGAASWSPLAGASTIVNAIAVNPITTGTVYMAGFPGGTETTTGGGIIPAASAWRSFLSPNYFLSLAIDPSNPGTVYAGTGGCASPSTNCNNSIYRGVNGTFSGVPIGSLSGGGSTNLQVHALAVDPNNSSLIWAGSETGVYKSTNGGVNWSLNFPVTNAFALAMRPSVVQGQFYMATENGVQGLFAGLGSLSNISACLILVGLKTEVADLANFGFLSTTQAAALFIQITAEQVALSCGGGGG